MLPMCSCGAGGGGSRGAAGSGGVRRTAGADTGSRTGGRTRSSTRTTGRSVGGVTGCGVATVGGGVICRAVGPRCVACDTGSGRSNGTEGRGTVVAADPSGACSDIGYRGGGGTALGMSPPRAGVTCGGGPAGGPSSRGVSPATRGDVTNGVGGSRTSTMSSGASPTARARATGRTAGAVAICPDARATSRRR